MQDVYEGLGLAGVPRGTIKQLRVVALDFRAAAIGNLSHQGRGGSSEVTTPVAVGNGSWDVKVVLGTARVYEDGTAMFHAPARTPLYFQTLDEKERTVQTMRSWATLMPGEAQACVGCHEHENTAPAGPGPVPGDEGRAAEPRALLRAGPRVQLQPRDPTHPRSALRPAAIRASATSRSI